MLTTALHLASHVFVIHCLLLIFLQLVCLHSLQVLMDLTLIEGPMVGCCCIGCFCVDDASRDWAFVSEFANAVNGSISPKDKTIILCLRICWVFMTVLVISK